MDNLLEELLEENKDDKLVVALIELIKAQRKHIKRQNEIVKEMGSPLND